MKTLHNMQKCTITREIRVWTGQFYRAAHAGAIMGRRRRVLPQSRSGAGGRTAAKGRGLGSPIPV